MLVSCIAFPFAYKLNEIADMDKMFWLPKELPANFICKRPNPSGTCSKGEEELITGSCYRFVDGLKEKEDDKHKAAILACSKKGSGAKLLTIESKEENSAVM